ncbi:hypothetical protein MKW94_006213 [Papaver nudicaule]|uniref:Myb-like domain-containing protein n=1 Tax=Papaver nudicaule TaxID=74823 RepID=A0AA41SLF3_PAPNU|nr:hypothetical protein [Papaver nudicaule]
MEFLDEESRPSRFMFQAKASAKTEPESLKVNKTLAISCIIVAVILIISSIFIFESEILKFIIFWFSVSLIVGPFAPKSITGGDIRVGQGQILEPVNEEDESTDQIGDKRRGSNRKQNQTVKKNDDLRDVIVKSSEKLKMNTTNANDVVYEEKEWVEEDFEILKKQILKHPVGEPKRWELITEAFQGRHGLESVINMGKSLSERKIGNGSQFLKQRKPLLDKRLVEESNGDFESINDDKKENTNWTSAEDVALLNALKTFPKDVAMRWEKVAAAVPGKTKALCMKREKELKNDFRSGIRT